MNKSAQSFYLTVNEWSVKSLNFVVVVYWILIRFSSREISRAAGKAVPGILDEESSGNNAQ